MAPSSVVLTLAGISTVLSMMLAVTTTVSTPASLPALDDHVADHAVPCVDDDEWSAYGECIRSPTCTPWFHPSLNP